MTYVDGFVAAVPTANKEAYRKHAEAAAVVFKEHGALSLVECWGDDVPEGKINSLHTAVMRKDDETVVFSWITLAGQGDAGCRLAEDHGRSADAAGRQPDALRWQPDDLRRLRDDR
jgi:uncharacterized protein YbaA (DUF1428 family)